MTDETAHEEDSIARPDPFLNLTGWVPISYTIILMIFFLYVGFEAMLFQQWPSQSALLVTAAISTSFAFVCLTWVSLRWVPLTYPTLYDLVADTRLALRTYWNPFTQNSAEDAAWTFDDSSTPYVDLRQRISAAVGTTILLTTVLLCGAVVIAAGTPSQDLLMSTVTAGVGIGLLGCSKILISWRPSNRAAAERELYRRDAASDSLVIEALTEPSQNPRDEHFLNPYDVYKAAEWFTEFAPAKSVDAQEYKKTIRQLKEIGETMDAGGYVGARPNQRAELNEMLEDPPVTVAADSPRSGGETTSRSQPSASIDKFKEIVKTSAKREYDYSSVSIFRLLTKGSRLFAGTKVKSGSLGSDVVILEIDLDSGTVLSRDIFGASPTSKAVENAQMKLDTIEGVTVDRSSEKSFLESLADDIDAGDASDHGIQTTGGRSVAVPQTALSAARKN